MRIVLATMCKTSLVHVTAVAHAQVAHWADTFTDADLSFRPPNPVSTMIPRSRRSNGRRFALHLLLPLATLGVAAAASATTWSDAEFLAGDWEATAVTTGGPASFSATQQLTAGNPAAHRVVTQTTSASAIWVFHRRVDASWDPAVDGAIDRIDATIDCRTIADNYPAGGQTATAVAVRQNGIIYRAAGFVSGNPPQAWSTHPEADLTETDFVEWLTLTGSPDFSASGSPVEFGFMTSNNTPPTPTRVTVVGYDNWSVVVSVATGVEPDRAPEGIVHMAAPNPFTHDTAIRFELEQAAQVYVRVFDPSGREVWQSDVLGRSAGSHAVSWDGRDSGGSAVSGGAYFYTIEADGRAAAGRMIRMR